MKKYYRNRIMFSAILSFLIVLVIAVAGILLLSYHRLERNSDSFIASKLVPREEDGSRYIQDTPPAMFGYNPGRRNTSFHDYKILFSPDGEMEIQERPGGTDSLDDSVLEYVRNAFGKGIERGKTGSYKFGIRVNEDGSGMAVLVDLYSQLHSLSDFLKAAGLVGIGIFLLLIIVLFPVSGKMADIFVRNAEEQRRFITDAGHDLKTPVAIARANLDVLELREGQSKWSGNVRAQVNRMEHLVQYLIMMARLDEGKNEEIFGLHNISIVNKEAPGAFEGLPVPDVAFVGGSGGDLGGILRSIVQMNDKVRIAMTAITIETATASIAILEELEMQPEMIHIAVSSTKKAGAGHMIIAQNPIWLITGRRR